MNKRQSKKFIVCKYPMNLYSLVKCVCNIDSDDTYTKIAVYKFAELLRKTKISLYGWELGERPVDKVFIFCCNRKRKEITVTVLPDSDIELSVYDLNTSRCYIYETLEEALSSKYQGNRELWKSSARRRRVQKVHS